MCFCAPLCAGLLVLRRYLEFQIEGTVAQNTRNQRLKGCGAGMVFALAVGHKRGKAGRIAVRTLATISSLQYPKAASDGTYGIFITFCLNFSNY